MPGPPFCDDQVLRASAETCDTDAGVCVPVEVLVEDCEARGRVCVVEGGGEGPADSRCELPARLCDGEAPCPASRFFCTADGGAVERVDGTCSAEAGVCLWAVEVEQVCEEGFGCVDDPDFGVACVDLSLECPFPCPVLRPGPPQCDGDVSRQLVAIVQNPETCACEEVFEEEDCMATGRFCEAGQGCVECTDGGQCAIIGVPTCEEDRVVAPVGTCIDNTCGAENQVVDDCVARGTTCDPMTAECLATE